MSNFRIAAVALCGVMAAGSGCGQVLLTNHDSKFRDCMLQEQRVPIDAFGGLSRNPKNMELAVIVPLGRYGVDKYYPGPGVVVGPDGKSHYPSTSAQSAIMQAARACYLKHVPNNFP
ncbi:MAG: hypothetical protein WBK91_06900 [Alphaproteobacteria bacterium]